ncbi:MAG: hypothetical protein JWO67_2656 [Streptosporangiaceae bacterium]|nr:hypothetical protein [Streptosporangiaceae bacterium]
MTSNQGNSGGERHAERGAGAWGAVLLAAEDGATS